MRSLCFVIGFLCLVNVAAAGPRIDVVVGTDVPALERRAAGELVSTLRRAFDADAQIVNAPTVDAVHVFFVGSPDSNVAMQPFRSHWPSGEKKLSDQGHLLRSVLHQGKPALLVGGGSPVASHWAVAEFAHKIGQRSLLFGDLPPVTPTPLNLAGWEVLIEPKPRWREWRFAHRTPVDSAAWGIAEYRAVLQQLVKLKFNRVSLSVEAIQPIPGISVAGDTAGRKAFGGAKLFENPDFSGATTDVARHAASEKLSREIHDAAEELGIKFVLTNAERPNVRTVQLNAAENVLPRVRSNALLVDLAHQQKSADDVLVVAGHFLGDLDLSAYCVSRASSGQVTSTADMWRELLTPVCGAEVDSRVAKAIEMIDNAAKLIDANDPMLGENTNLLTGFASSSAEPPPAWWNDVRTNYLNAMNEMYRANTRARDGGRAFTLYFARRFEFAYEYMNCVEAIRKTRIAEEQKDAAMQVAELEKAIESLNAGLNAMAAVARSSSDRGLIAVLNEHGYRPLKKRLAEAEAALP